MAAAAILVRFVLSLNSIDPFPAAFPGTRTTTRRLLPALVLWGVYILAVCISLVMAGELFTSNAGTLWRPLLFLVMLLTPLGLRDLRRAGIVYLLGGVAAGVALFLVNRVAGFETPALVFTGLTTFADQTALLAILTVSLIAFQRSRLYPPIGIVAAGILLMVLLFWTAERAPIAVLAIAGTVLVALARPRLLVLWGVLAVGLFFLAPPGLRARTEWVVRGYPIDRYVVWEEGARLLHDVPLFGTGPASFTLLLSPLARTHFSNRPPGSWHNDFLQTALDSGPVAASAWGALVLLCAGAACRVAWNCRRSGRRFFRAMPGILFLSLTALGLVGSVVSTALLGSVYWSVMGLTLREWISPDSDGGPAPARISPSHHAEDL